MKKIVAFVLVLAFAFSFAYAEDAINDMRETLMGINDNALMVFKQLVDEEIARRQAMKADNGEPLLRATFDGCIVTVDKIELVDEGKPILLVYYSLVNPNKEAQSFSSMFFTRIYQDGIEVSEYSTSKYSNTDMRRVGIKDGATSKMILAFELWNAESLVEIQLRTAIASQTVSGVFAIPKE